MGKFPFNPQPLQIADFSGGMTDDYIAAPINKYQRADNMEINERRQLVIRPGSEINDAANAYLPSRPKLCSLVSFEDEIIQYAGRKIYKTDTTEITGPSGNPALTKSDGDNYLSHTKWNDHLLVCNDAYSLPMKVFMGSSDLEVHNLGLPKIDLPLAIGLANDLKAKFNSHIADASEHASADATNVITSDDATDFDTLITLVTELITDYDAHEGDAELGSGWSYHNAQEASNHSLDSLEAPTSVFGVVTRLTDLKEKIDAHDADSTAHTTGGTHQSVENIEVQASGTAGSNNYIYAFHYVYEYTLGGRTFRENGSVSYISIDSVDAPDSNSITLSNIPELTNGSTYNFDTTNVQVEIYRTVTDGDAFYFVGVVDNGTTSYVDSTSDTDIQNNKSLYTDGGELDNDMPPECIDLVQADNVTLALGVKEGTVSIPNRIRFAKPNQPYSFPESLYEDLDDEIVGGASVGRFPIVFCKEKIYRIEGSYDAIGRGFVNKQQISNTVGCVSKSSIVETRLGIFFCSSNGSGFYHTDGYQITKISEDIPDSFRAAMDTAGKRNKVTAIFDSLANRVLFSVQNDDSNDDNDMVYVAHTRWGISPNTPFTRWIDINASSLLFANNTIYRGTKDGYLLKHDSDLYVDPEIDTTKAASDFHTKTIMYDYRSPAFNFNTSYVRKWVSKIVVSADNLTNLSMSIFSNNDNSGILKELRAIQTQGNIAWGDPDVVWGENLIRWNYLPVIEEWRRFPSGGLRCSYKQVIFSNLYADIDDSTQSEVATVDDVAKTVTLPSGDSAWYSDCEGYYISFEGDSYVTEYLITDRTDRVLTFKDDAGNSSSASDTNWKIRGYKKNEVLSLIGYTVEYSMLTTTQNPYAGSAS